MGLFSSVTTAGDFDRPRTCSVGGSWRQYTVFDVVSHVGKASGESADREADCDGIHHLIAHEHHGLFEGHTAWWEGDFKSGERHLISYPIVSGKLAKEFLSQTFWRFAP